MSTRTRHREGPRRTFPNGTQNLIRHNPRAFRALLDEPTPIHGSTEYGIDFARLRWSGLIEAVGRCRKRECVDNSGRRCNTRLYDWADGAREYVEAYLPELDATPCPNGHPGVQNVRGESQPGYSCSDDDCDCRFDREAARSYLSQRGDQR